MNKQDQDLATGKWYWRDEYVEKLEAEVERLREAAQRYLDAGKHTQERTDAKVALWRALARVSTEGEG